MKVYKVTWGFKEYNTPALISSNYTSNYHKQEKMFLKEEDAIAFEMNLKQAAEVLLVPFQFFSKLDTLEVN